MTCNVTGTAISPNGQIKPGARITFRRAQLDVVSQEGSFVIPDDYIIQTALDGTVDFDILPGVYDATTVAVGGRTVAFRVSVPDEPAADFADILGSAYVEIPPASVTQAQQARDAAIAARDAAQASAVSAETARDAAEAAADAAALYDGPWVESLTALSADTTLTYIAGGPFSVAPGDYVRTRAEGLCFRVASASAFDQHLATAGGVKLYEAGTSYTTRQRFAQAIARGELSGLINGTTVTAGGLEFVRTSGATAISDLPGWLPVGSFTPLHWGAVGDGIADDSAALQQWASLGGRLHWPAGQYRVTSDNAVPISVATYSYGDATLDACLFFKAGAFVTTDGANTVLVVENPNSDTCGIAIGEDVSGDPSSHSQTKTTIGEVVIRVSGSNGRYGVVTPENASLLANKRPRYKIDAQFAPPPGEDDKTISPYGWDVGIKLGSFVEADVRLSGYGTYNATIADAGQHQMVGVDVQSVGSYGLSLMFQASNMRTFFSATAGLEGFSVNGSEGLGCWCGIDISTDGVEPGGFIDNTHINAARCGYYLGNRSGIQIGMIEAYRADGLHNHGSDWDGMILENCAEVTIENLRVVHGSLLGKSSSSAISANSSTFVLDSYRATYLANLAKINNCPDCVVGFGTVNNVDTLYNLSGSATNDFVGSDVAVRAGATKYLVTDGSVDKKRIRIPQDTLLSVRKYQDITVSAAGSTTIYKRSSASIFHVIMSAGSSPFTYDIILDRVAAVPGDIVQIKISGSGSTNPTVRICDNSTSTILSSFNSLGGTTRLVCEYILNESGVWVERSIFNSLELSY